MEYKISATDVQDNALAAYLEANGHTISQEDFVSQLVTAQLDVFVSQMRTGERNDLIAKFEAADATTQDSVKAILEQAAKGK